MSKEDKNTKAVVEEEIINDTENTIIEESEKVVEEQQESAEEKLKAEKERYLRLFAEFENYKKRTLKERIELFKTASQDIMVAVLPVLDDFDRAMNEYSGDKDDVHVQGMTLINNKLKETLKQKGLSIAETNTGDVFNADLHEAITQIPAPSDDMKGKIIDVIEKGYTLGDKIIRFPKVVIGQ